MRRPWSALVVPVALVMLLSSGASTMAQDQGPAGFATGTITIGDSARGGSETVEGGRLTITDMAIDAVAVMSDPRLSGSLSWIWNVQVADFQNSTLGVAWGTGLLENDDGAWEGTWAGAVTMDLGQMEMQWGLQGQGPYEGLSALLVLTSLEGQVFAYDAVIVEGAPPTVLVAAPSTQALDEDPRRPRRPAPARTC